MKKVPKSFNWQGVLACGGMGIFMKYTLLMQASAWMAYRENCSIFSFHQQWAKVYFSIIVPFLLPAELLFSIFRFSQFSKNGQTQGCRVQAGRWGRLGMRPASRPLGISEWFKGYPIYPWSSFFCTTNMDMAWRFSVVGNQGCFIMALQRVDVARIKDDDKQFLGRDGYKEWRVIRSRLACADLSKINGKRRTWT